MGERYAKWLLSLMLVFLFTGFTSISAVEGSSHDLQAKLAAGQLVQKVDAFAVIFDSTLSMNEIYKNNTKLSQEKALVSLFNETIPNLQLTAAAREFGQFTIFGDATSRSLFGPMNYSKSLLPQAIAPITSGKGFSPLDAALDGAAVDLRSQSGQMAVIAFSDGEDMGKYAPVAAAQRMKSAYGDRICIYTVQLGDNPDGRKLLQEVADASQCGLMVTGDSVSTPQGMADFVEKVFLKAAGPPKAVVVPIVREEPKPVVQEEVKAPAEEAPKVVTEPVSIRLNVEFATGKSNIRPKYHNEIKRVADYMKQYPETKAVIEGHTDNVGSEKSNVKLSQARANSVKNYLIKKFGIEKNRLQGVGYGPKKPIASNATKEGKQKNRRVEAVIETAVK